MSVYVFNNPGNITYNSFVYAYFRAWYTLDGEKDTWLKIASFKRENGKHVIINNRVEYVATTIVSEDGRILKFHNVKIRDEKRIQTEALADIERQCLDTMRWEEENQASYPFLSLFDNNEVKRKYLAINGKSTGALGRIEDVGYRQVKRVVSPPVGCSSCGKKRKR